MESRKRSIITIFSLSLDLLTTLLHAENHHVQSILSISNDLNELSKVRAFLRRFCNETALDRLDESVLNELELAANEAVANAIRHGVSSSDEEIRIEAFFEEGRIEIRITYQGVPFDRNAVPEPDFDGSRNGGFGLYIMESIMDEVSHTCEESGTSRIDLMKQIRCLS